MLKKLSVQSEAAKFYPDSEDLEIEGNVIKCFSYSPLALDQYSTTIQALQDLYRDNNKSIIQNMINAEDNLISQIKPLDNEIKLSGQQSDILNEWVDNAA